MTASTQTSQLAVGQPVDVTITVTNYGPNPAPILGLYSSPYTNAIQAKGISSSECVFVGAVLDGAVPASVLYWYVAGIANQSTLGVGETRSCHIQLSLSALAPAAPLPFSFIVGGTGAIPPDLNPANDVSTITLQLAAAPVPDVSKVVELLLIGFLAVCGAAVARKSEGAEA